MSVLLESQFTSNLFCQVLGKMKFDIVYFIEEINKPFEIESADPSYIYLEGIILPIRPYSVELKKLKLVLEIQ